MLGGTVEGDEGASVSTVNKIEEGKPGALSFLANPKYSKHLYTTESSIVLINKDFELDGKVKATLVRVDDAYQAFAKLLQHYQQELEKNKTGISKSASIAESAVIGKQVYIGPGVTISDGSVIGDRVSIAPNSFVDENVKIGPGTKIGAGVIINRDSLIGSDCTIHGGTVIGSDGFGFAPNQNEDFMKVPQIGNVIIEDRVEIGSNTTIDRATLGSTIIRRGVKLDNLIQVAHNVDIGENTVIAAQSGISGSTRIGKNCMIGGQVGIIGHLDIGDNVKIAAQSGVGNDVPDNAIIQGSPAFDVSEYRRSYVVFKKLPELWGKLGQMEKKLKTKGE